MILEAGGVGTLRYVSTYVVLTDLVCVCVWAGGLLDVIANRWYSYEHHNIDEPAIILGGGFVVE